MNTTFARHAAGAGALALVAALGLVACGGDDSNMGSGGGGAGGGHATSLFDKYGGAPTVEMVVDQAIAGLTADPKISPFFANVGKPGGDSVADLKGCLVLFFTNALGGPATYPGTLEDGFQCRSMTAAHAGLGIDDKAFDEFIMDLGGILEEDGVSEDDVGAIADSLNGLRGQVVTK